MKITSFALFFLVIFNNYVILNYFYVPTLYSGMGINYFFSFLFVIIVSICLYLILPKVLHYSDFRDLRKKKVFKWILTIYFIMTNILVLLISSISLAYNFYQNYSPFIFMFIFILFCIVLLKYHLSRIVNSSLIFFLIISTIVIYTGLTHFNLIDFSELRLIKFDTSILKYIGVLLFISFDNYVFMLLLPLTKKKQSKVILFANISFMLLQMFEGMAIVGLFGDALRDYKAVGYMLYNIEPNFIFLENFDFLYICFITFCCIVKLIFGFKFIHFLHYEKKKWFNYIGIAIVLFFACIIKVNWTVLKSLMHIYLYIVTGLLTIYLLYIVRLKHVKNK